MNDFRRACEEAVDAALVDAWDKKYAEQERTIADLRQEVERRGKDIRELNKILADYEDRLAP
jgi:hypothetical protein